MSYWALDAVKAKPRTESEERQRDRERSRTRKLQITATMRSLSLRAGDRGAREMAVSLVSDWRAAGYCGHDAEREVWSQFKAAKDEFWSKRKQWGLECLRRQLRSHEKFHARLASSVSYDQEVMDAKRMVLSMIREGYDMGENREELGDVIAAMSRKIELKTRAMHQSAASIEILESKLRYAQRECAHA